MPQHVCGSPKVSPSTKSTPGLNSGPQAGWKDPLHAELAPQLPSRRVSNVYSLVGSGMRWHLHTVCGSLVITSLMVKSKCITVPGTFATFPQKTLIWCKIIFLTFLLQTYLHLACQHSLVLFLKMTTALLFQGSILRKILLNRYFKGDHGVGANGPLSGAYAKTAQVGGTFLFPI